MSNIFKQLTSNICEHIAQVSFCSPKDTIASSGRFSPNGKRLVCIFIKDCSINYKYEPARDILLLHTALIGNVNS